MKRHGPRRRGLRRLLARPGGIRALPEGDEHILNETGAAVAALVVERDELAMRLRLRDGEIRRLAKGWNRSLDMLQTAHEKEDELRALLKDALEAESWGRTKQERTEWIGRAAAVLARAR